MYDREVDLAMQEIRHASEYFAMCYGGVRIQEVDATKRLLAAVSRLKTLPPPRPLQK